MKSVNILGVPIAASHGFTFLTKGEKNLSNKIERFLFANPTLSTEANDFTNRGGALLTKSTIFRLKSYWGDSTMHLLKTTLVSLCSIATIFVMGTANPGFCENDYWTGTASTTSEIGRTGNVGIGTENPNAQLEVDGSAIFNESGNDVDFRIEGDSETHLFFVDASWNTIGIGTSQPSAALHIHPPTDDQALKLQANAAQTSDLVNVMASDCVTEYITIEAAGNTIFNESGGDVDFRIEGDSESNLFFVDASTDRIGIGTSSPNATLEVKGGSPWFYNTGGTLQTNLKLGVFSDVTTTPLYEIRTDDIDVDALTIHGNRWCGDVRITRNDSSDEVSVSRIHGFSGQGAMLDLYGDESNNAVRVRLNADGDSYLKGGDFGIGTANPNAKLDVRGSVICNDDGEDNDLRVEGISDVNLIFANAGEDRVGIGTDTPTVKLEVDGKIRANSAFNLNGSDGASGTVTVVTSLQWDGSTLQMKTRNITTSGGITTHLGTESGWTNVP